MDKSPLISSFRSRKEITSWLNSLNLVNRDRCQSFDAILSDYYSMKIRAYGWKALHAIINLRGVRTKLNLYSITVYV